LATGLNAVLVGLFVVVVVVLLVDLATLWRFRLDLSAEGGATLAPDTLNALAAARLAEGTALEVIATSHQRRNEEARFKDRKVKDLLREVALVAPEVRTTFVDLDRDRTAAEALEISQYGTLVVRRGDVRVDFRERDVFSRVGDPKAGAGTLDFRGEALLARGIRQVLAGRTRQVVVLQGHGEPSLQDASSNGLARFTELMERQGWDVEAVDLLRDRDNAGAPALPDSADVAVLVAPRSAYDPSETEALRTFLRGGKAVVLFAEPEGYHPEIVVDWGVEWRDGIAMDRPSIVPFDDWWIPQLGVHPIVQDLEDEGLKVVFARGLPVRYQRKEGVAVTSLLRSSRNGWAERAPEAPPADFDPGVDEIGPVEVALALQIDASSGAVKAPARVVVVGDATLIGSELMDRLGNPTFAINLVRWAMGDDGASGVAGRPGRVRTISLSPEALSRVGWLVVGGWPLLAVLGGAWIAYARRGR
jgi:hypothetical protein